MRMSSHPSLATRPSASVGLSWEQLDASTRGFLAHGFLTSGLKGPVLAALFVLIGALPASIALPPLDRDESRFAEASAQMLETGDVVNIRYQAEARNKKPVGIHWLQAASVKLLSSVEKRDIWAYRIPSLLGAMLAAAACAWGSSAFFGHRAGALAGAVLGASFILSSEAFIAKTDAALCGAVTLAMAALARLYGSSRGEIRAGPREKVLFWIGLSLSILIKGPIGPGVVGLAVIVLCVADRRIRWLKTLGWGWGLVIVLVMLGPWFAAITVSTDGAFWTKAVAGDIAPKIKGVQETHGAPPGFYLALAPLMLFPASFLLPAALAAGWRGRALSGVRFALAWLIPMWLVFEIAPTKLVHYTLPLYGALAWLIAAALKTPTMAIGPVTRMTGVALSVLAGATFAALTALAARAYGQGWPAFVWATVVATLALATGGAGAWALLRGAGRAGPCGADRRAAAAPFAPLGVRADRRSAGQGRPRSAQRRHHRAGGGGRLCGAESGVRPRRGNGARQSPGRGGFGVGRPARHRRSPAGQGLPRRPRRAKGARHAGGDGDGLRLFHRQAGDAHRVEIPDAPAARRRRRRAGP
jgi:4-amino-4-deoxy-L-arabinose transferase-like glycosyltransferase